MENALGRIIAIVCSVFVLFTLPLIIISLKMENMTQSYIDNAIVEFVDNSRSTAVITDFSYEKLCNQIDSVQSNCTISIKHSSKYVVADGTNIETLYYDYFKDDILRKIYTPSGLNDKYRMQNGDFISVTVYNNSPTLATQLYRLLLKKYNPSGKSIYATYSGYVGNNAN